MTYTCIRHIPSHTQLMGIHFKPGGAYPFLNFPLSALQNQIVSAELLWGNFAVELCARLHAAPSIQARLLLFEELLRTRLHDAPYGLDIDCFFIRHLFCFGLQ